MADNNQLTVAEILARAKQANPDDAPTSRRRRRRSVDNGGVSVAELTGELAAVKSDPAQARHSNVPLDSQAQEAADDAAPAEPVAPAAPVAAPDAARQSPSNDETTIIEKVRPGARVGGSTPVSAQPVEETTLLPKVDDPAPAPAPVAPEQVPNQAAEKAAEDSLPLANFSDHERVLDEEESYSAGAVLGLILLCVVLGALVFLGFHQLWGRFPVWACAAAGVVVTLVMIIGVKVMRAGRAGAAMALAGLAGLAITFGPAVLIFT
ncbi:hypothetical protein [Corynebacterium uterequi]|uniref:Uncharacterized protein n=1 Tax=Corynebacterium uterequi TaxID=1072256 RepID=A0A0G3HGL2_9CORY|nr:hypothetical protein [Corynebacterium uterequi]AKK10262.1 hypothetical protein CUTER_01210 [Corynebacterium uterequi]